MGIAAITPINTTAERLQIQIIRILCAPTGVVGSATAPRLWVVRMAACPHIVAYGANVGLLKL